MQENTLENVVCEMVSILFRPQCVKIHDGIMTRNVLRINWLLLWECNGDRTILRKGQPCGPLLFCLILVLIGCWTNVPAASDLRVLNVYIHHFSDFNMNSCVYMNCAYRKSMCISIEIYRRFQMSTYWKMLYVLITWNRYILLSPRVPYIGHKYYAACYNLNTCKESICSWSFISILPQSIFINSE